MKNIKISTKLLAGFLFITLIGVFLGCFGLVSLKHSAVQSESVYADVVEPIATVTDITNNFQRIRSEWRTILLVDSEEENKKSYQNIENYFNEIDALLPSF
ncbi:MAG: MCP four helix bundle domain-containing protein, partial [Anaerotignaceae bacterium]